MSIQRNTTVGGVVKEVGAEQEKVVVVPEKEAEKPILPAGLPPSGEFVSMRIDEARFRPLLVLDCNEKAEVAGILFLLASDAGAWYVSKYCFSRPSKDKPFEVISGVKYGVAIGQWRERHTVVLENEKKEEKK